MARPGGSNSNWSRWGNGRAMANQKVTPIQGSERVRVGEAVGMEKHSVEEGVELRARAPATRTRVPK